MLWARNGDTLWVEWTGFLADGSMFGSSQVEPATRVETTKQAVYCGEPYGPFVLGQGEVIPGVDKNLQGMCLGEQRTLVVPPHLAYGAEGTKGVPGNSTLTFNYELVKAYPRLNVETTHRPRLCEAAAGEGSQMGVHYTTHFSVMKGRNTNWTKLHDSITDHNGKFWGPFELRKGGAHLIEGLYRGLNGMCLHEMRHVTIPPGLAYGENGIDGYVPGEATLYFTLELAHLNQPTFRAEVISMPSSGCSVRVVTNSVITIHYSVYTLSDPDGNYPKTNVTLQLLQTSRGREPWKITFNDDTDMVEGLRMGLHGMCVGEKRRLKVPPAMAWGVDGLQGFIHGDATVLFLVELLDVQAPSDQQASKRSTHPPPTPMTKNEL